MDDKIKEKIDNDKKDKEVIKEYIESFVASEKVKETFADNEDFKKLKGREEIQEIKEEDEFF